MGDYADTAAVRADKLFDVLVCLRKQLGILDDLGQHAVAAKLSQAVDILEGEVAVLQADCRPSGDL